ncbi:hypothetical protein [Streptomyces sp. L2]|uniref:hypothetical protein n=1 Tax=Streptomyces sp. L2 TaxID=2162665 RepID=UPI001012784A|nr:hypothetical protein [Streptomyces sp. L2]
MKPIRSLSIAASLTAAAALLLSGCGGGGHDSGNGKIKGASEKPSSAAPSASASTGPKIDRPDLTLPSDLEIKADWTAPSDPTDAAVLNDSVDFLRAINLAVTKQETKGAAFRFYVVPASAAKDFAEHHVQVHIDKKHSVTGVEVLTQPKVSVVDTGKTAVASFCVDDSKYYAKDLKTGKAIRTQPSLSDYTYMQIVMTASEQNKGLWRAKDVKAEGSAEKCK